MKLFRLLIDRKLCPIVMLCAKWAHNKTPLFKTTNGVKQGGVLSPIIFTFCGTFSYADDIIILAPTLTSAHHNYAIYM